MKVVRGSPPPGGSGYEKRVATRGGGYEEAVAT